MKIIALAKIIQELDVPTIEDAMLKADYDPDGNGVVDDAESAESVAWGDVTGAPADASDLDGILASEKGAASGVATLGVDGKLTAGQVPAGITAGLSYKGTWNATTNVPAIPAAAAGNTGYFYVVSVAGTTTIDGISAWNVGDWIVSDGAAWSRIPTLAVTSVAGRTGVVVLTSADVSLGNVLNALQLRASQNLADLVSVATARTNLGLGTAAVLTAAAANGAATLDADGKLVSTQLPASILGSVKFQGGWDADTNTPTMAAAAPANQGYYYVVTVDGTTTVDGISVWEVGDWIISNGTTWSKVPIGSATIVLQSPNGTNFRQSIDNDGNTTWTEVV